MLNQNKIQEELHGIKILFAEPLKNFTFTKVGGNADALIFPKTIEEVRLIVDYAQKNKIPYLVLGNASNLIVRDGGIRGFVLMLTDMTEIIVSDKCITAQAGAELIDVTKEACKHHLTGFEFACGIPGSIGGAVYMNAGAYDGEIQNIFTSCEVLLENGTIETWQLEEMNFSYRHSKAQEQKVVILSASFHLEKGEIDNIQARMDELTRLRQEKQPLEFPSCGSVFKRPEGYFTGKLIQDANLQGFKYGGAQISEKHAGFIVNIDNATARDYEELIAYIIKVVKEKFDVTLEVEVRIIGESL
ncbi:UDP-N-acetylmuramate dehydrogenase [Pilibacter termitis]|uniref:UDP-N-acetylenolpyruvoylglucosamine reductase n=2 Tax=Pilibacter termitis TaxID=263852 RepID=A0A1T4MSZ3_9ENTE|nr:UDP-N-acetylmuramate dehydrogenase [Pilibacter termitis]